MLGTKFLLLNCYLIVIGWCSRKQFEVSHNWWMVHPSNFCSCCCLICYLEHIILEVTFIAFRCISQEGLETTFGSSVYDIDKLWSSLDSVLHAKFVPQLKIIQLMTFLSSRYLCVDLNLGGLSIHAPIAYSTSGRKFCATQVSACRITLNTVSMTW